MSSARLVVAVPVLLCVLMNVACMLHRIPSCVCALCVCTRIFVCHFSHGLCLPHDTLGQLLPSLTVYTVFDRATHRHQLHCQNMEHQKHAHTQDTHTHTHTYRYRMRWTVERYNTRAHDGSDRQQFHARLTRHPTRETQLHAGSMMLRHTVSCR